MKQVLCALALCAAASQSQAAPRYLDDRSTPEQVLESFYNAVNRREYARAWSYFGTPPVKDFAAFAKGFADTEDVQLTLGAVSSEGAAGSTFHAVPVAIRARNNKGEWKVFAGCYTLKQVNATIQDPPFRGILIEKASLKPWPDDNTDAALPKSCGDAPAVPAGDALMAKATAIFEREQGHFCDWTERYDESEFKPEAHEISFRYSYDEASQPDRKMTLFMFPCGAGAYNTTEVYYLADPDAGISALSFAAPDFDLKYEGEDSAKLKSFTLRGFAAQDTLVNSGYDPATRSITSFSKWRGIGDASSTGSWAFVEGRFVLRDYEVDPTYDEQENAFPVVKDGQIVPVTVP